MKKKMTLNLSMFCLALLLLAACDKSSKAAAANAISPGKSVNSYEIVLVTKPEPLASYVQKTYIGAYDLCAASAAIVKLPVAPFPGIPKDFFEERKTYVRDGENFFEKKETYVMDIEPFDKHCVVKFGISSISKIVRGDISQTVTTLQDGTVTLEDSSEYLKYKKSPAFRKTDLEIFSRRETKGGMAVRCIDRTTIAVLSEDYEHCVYDDSNGGSLVDSMGELIDLYLRVPDVTLSESGVEIAHITQARVFQIGKKIDSNVFKVKQIEK
jgi:hypothetical protein